MPPHKCSYFGCGNKSSEKSMFRFPCFNINRLEEWVNNCGNMTIAHLPPENLRSKYICVDHFKKKYVCSTNRCRKTLLRTAIPEPYHQVPDRSRTPSPGLTDLKVLKPKKVYGNSLGNVIEDPLSNENEVVNSGKRKLQGNETNQDTPECKRLAETEPIASDSIEPIQLPTLHQCDDCFVYFISLEDLRVHATSDNHETSQFPDITSQNSPQSTVDEEVVADCKITLNEALSPTSENDETSQFPDITSQNSPQSTVDEEVVADCKTTLNEVRTHETSQLEITLENDADTVQCTVNRPVVAEYNIILNKDPKASRISVPRKSNTSDSSMASNPQLNSEEATHNKRNTVILNFYEVSSDEDEVTEVICDLYNEQSNPETEQSYPEEEADSELQNLVSKNTETQESDNGNVENEICNLETGNVTFKCKQDTPENEIGSPSYLLDNGISESEENSDSELISPKRELNSPIEPISQRIVFEDSDDNDDYLLDDDKPLDQPDWKFGKCYKNTKCIKLSNNNTLDCKKTSRIPDSIVFESSYKDEPLNETIDYKDDDDISSSSIQYDASWS